MNHTRWDPPITFTSSRLIRRIFWNLLKKITLFYIITSESFIGTLLRSNHLAKQPIEMQYFPGRRRKIHCSTVIVILWKFTLYKKSTSEKISRKSALEPYVFKTELSFSTIILHYYNLWIILKSKNNIACMSKIFIDTSLKK